MAQDRQFVEQWRAGPGRSRYPFADGARLAASTGRVVPPAVFVDAFLLVAGATGRVYLDSLVVADGQVTAVVGDGRARSQATGTFDPAAGPDLIALSDAAGRPAGALIADPAEVLELGTWPAGTHRFDPADGEFVASCVVPLPESGVTAFLLDDGAVLSGDVWLVGEDGVFLSNPDPEVVRVDVVGEPLWRRKACEPNGLFTEPRFVKTINGVAPDAAGRFTVTEGDGLAPRPVLRVRADAGGLIVELVGRRGG